MKKEKSKFKIVIISSLIFLLISAFYNGLVVRKYTIKTDKLLHDQSIKIVLITDLHSHLYGKGQRKIVKNIKDQNPDLIALAEDIADDEVNINGIKLILAGVEYPDIIPYERPQSNWREEVVVITIQGNRT